MPNKNAIPDPWDVDFEANIEFQSRLYYEPTDEAWIELIGGLNEQLNAKLTEVETWLSKQSGEQCRLVWRGFSE